MIDYGDKNMLQDRSDQRKNRYEIYYQDLIDKNKNFDPSMMEPEDIKQMTARAVGTAEELQEIIDNEKKSRSAKKYWLIGGGILTGLVTITAAIRDLV